MRMMMSPTTLFDDVVEPSRPKHWVGNTKGYLPRPGPGTREDGKSSHSTLQARPPGWRLWG